MGAKITTIPANVAEAYLSLICGSPHNDCQASPPFNLTEKQQAKQTYYIWFSPIAYAVLLREKKGVFGIIRSKH